MPVIFLCLNFFLLLCHEIVLDWTAGIRLSIKNLSDLLRLQFDDQYCVISSKPIVWVMLCWVSAFSLCHLSSSYSQSRYYEQVDKFHHSSSTHHSATFRADVSVPLHDWFSSILIANNCHVLVGHPQLCCYNNIVDPHSCWILWKTLNLI